jgi:protein TonB
MISRFLVPQNARISSTETMTSVVRQDLLARKRLIPAGARIPTAAENGASGNPSLQAARTFMVPKRLVPLNARVGEAAKAGGTTPAAARQAVFAEALLEKVSLGRRNKPAEWLLSFAIHAVLVAVVLIIPLFYAQVLDLNKFQVSYLAAPPAPGAPPPPDPPAAVAPRQIERKTNLKPGTLTMPIAVPKTVMVPSVAEAAPEIAGIPGGVAGGIPGGEIGGILGGLVSSSGPAPPPPPPIAAPVAPSGPVHVGGNVKPPRAIYKPRPEYPRMARNAQIQGQVEIDAIIDASGNVVGARAMSGPPLLFGAALEAVKQWKYEPTYLNGVPCSIELTVEVTFALS